jgi:hypothetical protein
MKSTAQDTPSGNAQIQVRPWHVVASVLLLLHVLAVWIAPFSVPPSSPLAQGLASLFRPYLEAAFLNHGYKFFAPDPGPTHLVRYELVLADGEKKEGIFPNLKEQRPRLLYHRHMMLSERLDGPPQAYWISAFSRSYAQHLLHQHNAQSVKLFLVTHALPSPQEVQSGMKLNDPRLYRERELLVLTRDGT